MAAAIVTVIRPILTDEERAKRMKEIERAAAALIIATEKAKILKARERAAESDVT